MQVAVEEEEEKAAAAVDWNRKCEGWSRYILSKNARCVFRERAEPILGRNGEPDWVISQSDVS